MGWGESYARFIENSERRISSTVGRLILGAIWGTGAGMCFGLIAGAITFGGLATLITATHGESISFILSTLMYSLAIGGVAGVMLGMLAGIIGMVIGSVASLWARKSMLDLAIRGGAVGGVVVATGGMCFLISVLTQLD